MQNNPIESYLDRFSINLNTLAKENKLDPVIGRDEEVRRILQILSRRTKNNPIILGEPGCVDENTLITVKKINNNDKHKIIEI